MSMYEFDAVPIEKEKAMRRYNRFHQVAGIVKTVEICVALTVLSWSVSRWSTTSSSAAAAASSFVPEAVRFCGDLIRRVSLLLFCPHFVFLLGNAVILTLLIHSSRDDGKASTGSVEFEAEASSDLNPTDVEAFLASGEERDAEKASRRQLLVGKERTRSAEFEVNTAKEKAELRPLETEPPQKAESHADREEASAAKERVEFRRTETDPCRVTETNDCGEQAAASKERVKLQRSKTELRPKMESHDDGEEAAAAKERVKLRRSETDLRQKTENHDDCEEAAATKERVTLRRSETDPRRKRESHEIEEVEEDEDVEDLSSEEFQRKVEAFIARQQRFLREEFLSAAF